ncbi:HAD-like domain-containing protein [Aspergillus pseudotamarii]|uniref:HAD-like domain-containing protein n=1 Tax=Aspergillus pseudotamarii TaxID=132259 RepID=A0A5N6STN4_ASPPS|nr:HAD-like domain-containing protein [Aspergillus pseudotamarii]KAE8138046.1 HAD-like domain-containing protein [Aspergillus pseudotamarii]
MPPPTTLAIFDFDGTLFDTHESISQTIKLTFDALLPNHAPPQPEIHRLIASGAGLSDTFRALHPTPDTFTLQEETQWIEKYRALYATHGQLLIKAFPGAQELLTELKAHNVPIAIVSNKGVAAVKTALERNGLGGYVPEELIIGDKTPGAQRKPDPASFVDVLVPVLEGTFGIRVEAGEGVLVVGDTVADIQFARNIGGRSCWCRYGYGDRGACEGLKPDYVVDSLGDVVGIVKG